MALMKADKNIPKKAVVLDERGAVSYQWQKILEWPKYLDVWAFRYGLGLLSGTAAITGSYIMRRHRAKLKLRNHGNLISLIGLMFAPAVGSAVLHTEFITNDVLLFKTPCPVCLQTKAAAIQFAGGVLYPLMFSPITCSLLALQAGIRIPYFKNGRELLNMWWNISKHMALPLSIMTAVQLCSAIGITYLEAKQLYELQEQLLAHENQKKISQSTDTEFPNP